MAKEKLPYAEFLEAFRRMTERTAVEDLPTPVNGRPTTVEEMRAKQTAARKALDEGKIRIAPHTARWLMSDVPPEAFAAVAGSTGNANVHSEALCAAPDECHCPCPQCNIFSRRTIPRSLFPTMNRGIKG